MNYQIATEYQNNIITGIIPGSIYVRQQCDRFLKDLQNPDYYYDSDSVDRIVTFINALPLTEQSTPTPFRLEAWQTFIIANLYGIKRKDNQRRKYRNVYLELQRKNGKSQLVTALQMYHLLTDVDQQVIISANSREQAKNVDFKKVKQFAHHLDSKEKHLVPYYSSLKFRNNELIVTASDSKRLDGLNASFCLIDELHEQPDNSMYNVLKSSQGSRIEPLLMTVTTAGFNTASFCYELRTYCTEVLSGMKTDESQFQVIYTLDSEDNFEDRTTWIKQNPNLGVSVFPEFIEGEVQKAVNNNSERSGVLVKHFNQWLKSNSEEVWIEDKFIDASMINLELDSDLLKDSSVIVGVDLASVSDITQVSYLFVVAGQPIFINKYYLPEDSLNTSINRKKFKEWQELGYITLTSGNVTDYNRILKDIMRVNDKNPIQALYYDKWNSTQFAIEATEAGLNLQPFSQMPGNLNKPLKEFERLIKSDKLSLQRNPVTKWMLQNVIINTNKFGNYSIDKQNRANKIDGVQAMINAYGGLLTSPIYSFEIY